MTLELELYCQSSIEQDSTKWIVIIIDYKKLKGKTTKIFIPMDSGIGIINTDSSDKKNKKHFGR